MTEPPPRLIEPTEAMEAAYRDFLADFAAAGEAELHGTGASLRGDFAAFVRRLRDEAAGRGLRDGWVPASTFWLVAGGEAIRELPREPEVERGGAWQGRGGSRFNGKNRRPTRTQPDAAAADRSQREFADSLEVIGACIIRHRLTDALLDFGGHIGYGIRPSRRGRGYGRLILQLALQEARKLGIRRALVSCDRDNARSARVIEANGGVLDSESHSAAAGRVTRRYWIDLPPDGPSPDAPDIRPCTEADFEDIFQIVNSAAERYRGVIPADRWHEPYMPREELAAEVAAGVVFWGEWRDGRLVGVMGIQPVRDVSLIRHAYVRPECQGTGVGGRLIAHLQGMADRPLLVGTWAAATWAVRFYQKHGFRLVTPAEKDRLLRTYWSIPARQVETSVVLADRRWLDAAAGGHSRNTP